MGCTFIRGIIKYYAGVLTYTGVFEGFDVRNFNYIYIKKKLNYCSLNNNIFEYLLSNSK